jgi:nucleoid DNA-binding protein
MTRAELIAKLASAYPQLTPNDIDLTVRTILDEMSCVLSIGGAGQRCADSAVFA